MSDVRDGLPAGVRVLLETAADDVVDGARDQRLSLAQRRGLSVEDIREQARRRLATRTAAPP